MSTDSPAWPTDIPDLPAAGRALAVGRAAFGPGWHPIRRAIAPGRIELLGNHLDYNRGPVLCAAIDRRLAVVIEDGTEGDAIVPVFADAGGTDGRVRAAELHDWRRTGPPAEPLDYLRGVIAAVAARPGLHLHAPSRLAVAGDVPIGFGLSSSAALCVALALALVPTGLDPAATVLLAQEAEHRAGTPCGTMDQSASVAGGVIRFDGATLAIERLTPRLGDQVFAVVDSGVDRSLGASAYPRRVAEARQILAIAREVVAADIPSLAAVTVGQLRQLEALPPGAGLPATLLARLRHIVTETARVEAGVAALAAADWPAFGHLMTASGRSSATDYDVSHPRVEELVAETLAVAGVLGARMMGGGGGGTVLTLLPRDRVPALTAALRAGYLRRYALLDRPAPIQVCAFAAGATITSAPPP